MNEMTAPDITKSAIQVAMRLSIHMGLVVVAVWIAAL